MILLHVVAPPITLFLILDLTHFSNFSEGDCFPHLFIEKGFINSNFSGETSFKSNRDERFLANGIPFFEIKSTDFSSILLKPHPFRIRKMCRMLSFLYSTEDNSLKELIKDSVDKYMFKSSHNPHVFHTEPNDFFIG